MVAYSFKGRFAEPILSGAKRQTIRADRKRHARPGEELQLYTGMRTRSCRLIGRAPCTFVGPIRIDLEDGRIESLATGTAWTTLEEIDRFAQRDGFADWRDMARFWAAEHPDLPVFSGVLIQWGELRVDTPTTPGPRA
jgi:Uncharacterized protein conserved in bacteria